MNEHRKDIQRCFNFWYDKEMTLSICAEAVAELWPIVGDLATIIARDERPHRSRREKWRKLVLSPRYRLSGRPVSLLCNTVWTIRRLFPGVNILWVTIIPRSPASDA